MKVKVNLNKLVMVDKDIDIISEQEKEKQQVKDCLYTKLKLSQEQSTLTKENLSTYA